LNLLKTKLDFDDFVQLFVSKGAVIKSKCILRAIELNCDFETLEFMI